MINLRRGMGLKDIAHYIRLVQAVTDDKNFLNPTQSKLKKRSY